MRTNDVLCLCFPAKQAALGNLNLDHPAEVS